MARASSHQTSSSKWSEIVKAYYPEALNRTHVVPPVHFNRVPYTMDTVPGTRLTAFKQIKPGVLSSLAGQPLFGPPPPPPPQTMWPEEPQTQLENVYDSDLRDDAAQARIIRNLEELGRHRQEVMFILSQFNLQDYLNKSEYQVAASQLPHPSQLNRPGKEFSRGDFDVLIIHRHHGVLVGEVKSVGHNHTYLNLTEAQSDAAVVKRVERSLKQLDKLETVVRHVLSDITPHLTIRTSLFLPNVSRAQLHRVLAANPQLEQDVCRTLGASTGAEAVQLCCCETIVSGRDTWWNVSPGVLSELTKWWVGRMDSVDSALSDDLYLDILARFVGPASSVTVSSCTPPRVEVRTEGQAVAELGWRLSRLVLTPKQWDLRSKHLPLVYLTGPPGTGKTLMLVMEGVSWLLDNKDTFVVSTAPNTLAITAMIVKQLKQSAITDPTSSTPIGSVLHRHYDFVNDNTALARAVSELSAAAQGGACVLMDEALFDTSDDQSQRTYSLVRQLIDHVPGLHLWCAGVFYDNTPPSELQVEVLTSPLRSAPAVLREVQPTLDRRTASIHNYSDNGIPAPGDGQCLRHLRHEGGAHMGQWPVHCTQCGREIACELRRLGVGVLGSGVTFRDVLIITRSVELQDEVTVGEVMSPASGVVCGIREEGMPVCVLGFADFQVNRAMCERNAADMGMAATDRITAAHLLLVPGLERKVVVWLPGRKPYDDQLSDQVIDDHDRLHLVTRCTTQLVVVDVPPVTHQAAGDQSTCNNDNSRTGGAGGEKKKKKDNSANTGVSWARKGFLL